MERYKQVCQQINEQIKPSDEFMDNLKTNLNKRVTEEKMKRKNYFSKVAMIFVTLTLVSSGAFAMDIGDWLSKIFSNTDESLKIALENGYVQNVDTEYIEHDGIAIKVNSLVIDDNKMNLVFDVKGEIDGDLGVKNLLLSTDNSKYANENSKLLSTLYDREFKRIDKENYLLFLEISNFEHKLNYKENMEIILNGICIMNKNNDIHENNGIWNFDIELNENNFEDMKILATNYIIEENEYIENYEITETNIGLNIQLSFKELFAKDNLIKENEVYIETENGQKSLCRDYYGVGNTRMVLNIPLENEINVFKIILNVNNEELTFNVKKEKS